MRCSPPELLAAAAVSDQGPSKQVLKRSVLVCRESQLGSFLTGDQKMTRHKKRRHDQEHHVGQVSHCLGAFVSRAGVMQDYPLQSSMISGATRRAGNAPASVEHALLQFQGARMLCPRLSCW